LNLEAEGLNAETKERYEQVRRIVEGLPENYRKVIQMRDMDGFSFDEIKEVTGLEIPNIRVILSRARQKVKKEVEKIYSYEDTEQLTRKIL
jgi:RNA polymerase sigma-70 factor (ECF subfamily)